MSNERDDGGPAFPVGYSYHDEREGYDKVVQIDGMTLRDYFAAKAMPLAFRTWAYEGASDDDPREVRDADFSLLDEEDQFRVASLSYQMADAMLKARQA